MKKRFWMFFFASAGLFASAGVSVENAVADTETQAIAKDAYVYSYAMMESYQTWRTQAVDKTANGYVGGFNVFRHYSEPFTPDNKDIVTPNNDTPYSWAWLDLRAEPMVVSVPAVPKDRYYVMQWIDLFTQNFAYIGCVMTMYTIPDRFLYANPLNRYSIGDRTKGLEYGKDGSLTIYVSNASPGKDKESNWLPAPASKCSLVARVYGPSEAAMTGAWKLPPLQPSLAEAQAQAAAASDIPVTVDNFTRAESDLYFGGILKDSGAIGKFLHRREPARIDKQTVIRLNRDTLYSSAVFDLDAGPVTITLPDAGKRFMSMQVINEDHYVPEVVYGKGSYTLTRDKVGTRYVAVAIRTLVDPVDPGDVEQVHVLQDAIKVNQKAAGQFEISGWDQASQKKVRDALLVLGSTIPDFKKAFGTKDQVDPVRHLIGTASAWGGNPDRDATYLNITPAKNDGTTIYKLSVKDVPVDAFWSVSVYNAEGYFEKNPYEAYSINSITGKKNTDGAIAIQFGGCDGKIANCLPITKGWNYTVRLYRPRAEILNGKWKFPEPQSAG